MTGCCIIRPTLAFFKLRTICLQWWVICLRSLFSVPVPVEITGHPYLFPLLSIVLLLLLFFLFVHILNLGFERAPGLDLTRGFVKLLGRTAYPSFVLHRVYLASFSCGTLEISCSIRISQLLLFHLPTSVSAPIIPRFRDRLVLESRRFLRVTILQLRHTVCTRYPFLGSLRTLTVAATFGLRRSIRIFALLILLLEISIGSDVPLNGRV